MGRRQALDMRTILLVLIAGMATAWSQQPENLPTSLAVQDAVVQDPRLRISDATDLSVKCVDGDLAVDVGMAVPIAEGIFTCVNLYVDCDDNSTTGVRGNDLWVRAAVGSRFRPNAWKPPDPSLPAPLEIRSTTYSYVDTVQTLSTKESGHTFMLNSRNVLDPPVVDGKRLRFRVPRAIIREKGDKYHRRLGLYVNVVTSCAEQPFVTEYVCADEGLPLRVDGSDSDWTGEEVIDLPPDELHPANLALDTVRARVDHSATMLYFAIDFEKPGFGDPFPGAPDVRTRDRFTLRVEPLRPAYGKAIDVAFMAGERAGKDDTRRWAANGRLLEIAVPRQSEQTRFRIAGWSDLDRHDRIPDQGLLRMELTQ